MSVEIPPRLRARPRDKRGYVVPFAQFIAEGGEPNFTVMDHDKTLTCLRRRWCGLCGQPMGKHVHFVGGPKCVENRFFYDPPMHRECAIYALRACPHLARSKGRYRDVPEIEGATLVVGAMDVSKKVDYFALMHATSYDYGTTKEGMLIVRAAPWLDVEYWKDGQSWGPVPPTG